MTSTHRPAVVATRILLQVLLPIVLILTNVRLLLTQAYLQIEYGSPGFPDDPLGFTFDDRVYWASIALDYLLSDTDIESLRDLRFESGELVYNGRELRHLGDVKRLTQAVLTIWVAGLGMVILLLVVLWRINQPPVVLEGLMGGSQLTFYLMMALAVTVIADFSLVFVSFHYLFFEGDTWLFSSRDTLIRLFPRRFWRDAFTLIASATLAEAILTRLWLQRRWR